MECKDIQAKMARLRSLKSALNVKVCIGILQRHRFKNGDKEEEIK